MAAARRPSARWCRVYRFDTEDEAVRLANDDDVRAQRRGVDPGHAHAAGRCRAAARRHGQHQRGLRARRGAATDAPMGGMGDSGLGRRHGAEGLLKYTEAQTVAIQRLLLRPPPAGLHRRAAGWTDRARSAVLRAGADAR